MNEMRNGFGFGGQMALPYDPSLYGTADAYGYSTNWSKSLTGGGLGGKTPSLSSPWGLGSSVAPSMNHMTGLTSHQSIGFPPNSSTSMAGQLTTNLPQTGTMNLTALTSTTGASAYPPTSPYAALGYR